MIGNHTIFVNGASLAGHVHVEDYATIGAYCPVHQFCRIGAYSYIASAGTVSAGRAAICDGRDVA